MRKMPCPDCGSTNQMHYSWCRIHETPDNKRNEIRKVLDKVKPRSEAKGLARVRGEE